MRITAEQAEPVLDAMQYDTSGLVLPGISEDADGYARVVMPYLDAGTKAANQKNEDGSPEAPAAYPDRNNR